VKRWYAERLAGALAWGDEHHGVILGFELARARDTRSIGRMLLGFLKSGALASFGALRYVSYQPRAGGGTDFVNVWSDGCAIDRLVGSGGDAPGGDADGVPRFPGSHRVMVVGEEGQPQRLHLYRGPGSVVALREFYREQMSAGRWMEDEAFARFAAERGRVAMRFRREGREVYLDLARAGDGDDVVLGVIAMGP
jgi:hypothetical protein